MEFLLFLIFFGIAFGVISVLNYYFKLFGDREKDTFSREELIDFLRIIPKEMLSVIESHGDIQNGGIAFFLSAFFSYLWSLLGGLIGSPHYTNEFGNYFFQSFFILGILMATYTSLKEAILGDLLFTNEGHFLVKLLSQEIPILCGMGVSLIAANLSVYGLYHQTLFLFTLCNVCIIAALLLYKMSGKQIPDINFPTRGKVTGRKKEPEIEE
ncbi:MAG: hypothetical protein L6Q54_03260 [Leptospiraceae bacterium]|nr:hypothetical protein [Leptospiraceae bacterium]MCK6380255.1 hypothetical protein [Leptospiraceae bacterium]NUM40901.1 hypothetical protein [Leptospiraceae bacterium]